MKKTIALLAAAVTAALLFLPMAAANASTAHPYLAVMVSKSLHAAYVGRAPSKSLAEGYAYNQCLRAAKANPKAYKKDCNTGTWVQNAGWTVVFMSGRTRTGGALVEGRGWARTLARAKYWARYYCRAYGGTQCTGLLAANNLGSGTTTGGNWISPS